MDHLLAKTNALSLSTGAAIPFQFSPRNKSWDAFYSARTCKSAGQHQGNNPRSNDNVARNQQALYLAVESAKKGEK